MDVILKRFEQPDEVRTFEKGKFEIVRIGGMTIGRATYEPGWRWSLHVGPGTGKSSCPVEHVGLVISGRATAAMDDGTITQLRPGDVSTSRPDTTAGWSATSLTCLCIFSARTTTPTVPRRRSKPTGHCEERFARRSNLHDRGAAARDCFAPLAMTIGMAKPRPALSEPGAAIPLLV